MITITKIIHTNNAVYISCHPMRVVHLKDVVTEMGFHVADDTEDGFYIKSMDSISHAYWIQSYLRENYDENSIVMSR